MTAAPTPPAAAYGPTAATVSSWYFDEPPPPVGVQLTVTGVDDVPTRWLMAEDVADVVAEDLRRFGGLRVKGRRYQQPCSS